MTFYFLVMSKMISRKDANEADLVGYLASLGFSPEKVSGNDYWYLLPLRDEKTASFKIQRSRNIWYNHGLGKGGILVDFGMEYFNCSVINFLETFGGYRGNMFSFHPRTLPRTGEKKDAIIQQEKIKVLDSSPVNSPALIKYLDSRKISIEIAQHYCTEIFFELNGIKFTAMDFKNNAGGYELRNVWFKRSSSRKATTLIENSALLTLVVFEGFFSFLSFEMMKQSSSSKTENLPETQYNFLVLNSVSFFEKSRRQMEKFENIHLYLERDKMGLKLTQEALQWSEKYTDRSDL